MEEKITAYCFVKLSHQKLDSFLSQIKDLPQVKEYIVLTGEFDGVLKIQVNVMNQIYELFQHIDTIDGIEATTTHVQMKKFEFERD